MTQDNTELLPVTQEEVENALQAFNGGLIDLPDAANHRGYRTFYKPEARMRLTLEAFARHRLNTRATQGHDALVEAMDILGIFADVLEGDCGCPPCVGSMAPAEDALGRARELQARLTNLPSPQVEAAPDDGLGPEYEQGYYAGLLQGASIARNYKINSGWLANVILDMQGTRAGITAAIRDFAGLTWIDTMGDIPAPDDLSPYQKHLRSRPSGDGGWQPIETAPKDGRSILCYAPGAEIPAQMQWVVFEGEARWADDPETFCEDSHWREYWTSVRYEPTHWQPLPEPPALSTIKGEG